MRCCFPSGVGDESNMIVNKSDLSNRPFRGQPKKREVDHSSFVTLEAQNLKIGI